MSAKNITFTPPVIESKADPELAARIQLAHQLIFDRIQNHFEAIQNMSSQIAALQTQLAALEKGK